MENISVIIPSNHQLDDLIEVISSVCMQNIKPREIILVNSNPLITSFPESIIKLCFNNEIELIFKNELNAMPGHARNIGIGLAKSEIIAFLDVKTIPRREWLENSIRVLLNKNILIVYGSTIFNANNEYERLIRDCFHGVFPCITLPGSVCRKDIFIKTGQFIHWVRAGEDTEWMSRLKLMKVSSSIHKNALLDYQGLSGLNIRKVLEKWFRNYRASRNLPQFYSQRLILWVIFYPFILLIALNWNYLIADWRMESPLFIGHITKIFLIMPVIGYIITRGLILPYRRGVKATELLPFRFVKISLICFFADMIKVAAFSIPEIKYENKSYKI